jgi:nitrite reductase/ring-hydroxylating ferredoxin subunit
MRVKVCKTTDLPENSMKSFDIEGEPILIANVGGNFYSIADTCSHAMAYLSDGELLENGQVQCPDHGAVFDLKTGEALALPAVAPVETFKLTIEDGEIYVDSKSG